MIRTTIFWTCSNVHLIKNLKTFIYKAIGIYFRPYFFANTKYFIPNYPTLQQTVSSLQTSNWAGLSEAFACKLLE